MRKQWAFVWGLILITAGVPHAVGEGFLVKSPDRAVAAEVTCDESGITYTLTWRGAIVLERSAISLIPDAQYKVLADKIVEVDQTWEPVWGQFSEVRDHCRELTLKMSINEIEAHLVVRVYDEGFGYRFALPDQAGTQGLPLVFYSEFNPVEDVVGYYPNGEREPRGPERLSEWVAEAANPDFGAQGKRRASTRNMPALFELGDDSHLAVLESDLYSAKRFQASKLVMNPARHGVTVTANATANGSALVTPWRVVHLGQSPGDLLVNQTALNLAAPCEIDNPAWIKPGKGLWDWRILGYDNGDFIYGTNTRSYLRLIDFAAEYSIDYLTIDDHWFVSAEPGNLHVSPEVDIDRVIKHAEEKGVGVILYYDRNKGEYGDNGLFSFYRGLGAAGMKYGFMGYNTPFTRDAIDHAAASKMLIFFHDNPVPMTGVHRTMPNLITREYCHAQQDSRRAFTPESFLKMAMVNALSGPLDQANGNFGIQSINNGERAKGPRKQNTYISTVVSEISRTLVIYTGLITLPDAPEEYLKKADLFEFLKQMPATWDETRVLHSNIGEYITTARRSGDTWFVGSVNNETSRELIIDMDFLNPGITYAATLFEDARDAHGVKNPEAYDISKTTVQTDSTVTARMAVGGGHAMILRPVK